MLTLPDLLAVSVVERTEAEGTRHPVHLAPRQTRGHSERSEESQFNIKSKMLVPAQDCYPCGGRGGYKIVTSRPPSTVLNAACPRLHCEGAEGDCGNLNRRAPSDKRLIKPAKRSPQRNTPHDSRKALFLPQDVVVVLGEAVGLVSYILQQLSRSRSRGQLQRFVA